MKCSVCGKDNASSAKFCSKCGSPIKGEKNVDTETKIADTEVDITDDKNNEGKLSTKKYIVIGSIIGILIIAGVGLIKYNSKPINKWMNMMKSESYASATDYFLQVEDSMNTDDINKVRENTLNEANEILNKYKKQKIEYEVAINQLSKFQQIDMLSDSMKKIIDTITIINGSRGEFKAAEADYSAQKYDDALRHYKNVIPDDEDNYSTAQNKIEECVELYRDNVLSMAEELKNQGKYTDALVLINQGLGVLSNDELLSAKVVEYEGLIVEYDTQELIKSVQSLKNSGDLETATRMISNYNGNDSNAKLLKAQVESEYEQETVAFVENSIRENKLDQAKKKLIDAHILIPESKKVNEWLNSVDDYFPKSLVEMDTFKNDKEGIISDKGKWVSGTDHDNVGNSEFEGFKFSIGYYAGNEVYWLSHTYLIDGKYDVFSGIWSTNEESKDKIAESCWGKLSVWGDGVCLYTSPVTRGGIYPTDFEVDIKNIKELTIKIEGYGGDDSGTDLYVELLNPTLQKKF